MILYRHFHRTYSKINTFQFPRVPSKPGFITNVIWFGCRLIFFHSPYRTFANWKCLWNHAYQSRGLMLLLYLTCNTFLILFRTVLQSWLNNKCNLDRRGEIWGRCRCQWPVECRTIPPAMKPPKRHRHVCYEGNHYDTPDY